VRRKERRLRVRVWWEGDTYKGARRVFCHFHLYDARRHLLLRRSFVLETTTLLRASVSDPATWLMIAEQRYRTCWLQLREGWRKLVLGADWRKKKGERLRAEFMSGWKRDHGHVIDCGFCGETHSVSRHLADPKVRFECHGRVVVVPSFQARPRSKPDPLYPKAL
jgi:hypothetical protein